MAPRTHVLPATGLCCGMPKITNLSDRQKDAETKLEDYEEPLGAFLIAAESTRMAMVVTDEKQPRNPIIFANDGFCSRTGHDRKEVSEVCRSFFPQANSSYHTMDGYGDRCAREAIHV